MSLTAIRDESARLLQLWGQYLSLNVESTNKER
jgi:hypothetical protein